ncbi:hypothetical protein M407DRAFT_26875 [Tulasnella calospora MUT 4182]|uniref:Uncharacterized protein n=1 Tax=Tulasnella calospora MUT 4182 TaxID=1051891 RepID=A0A0C3KQJ5_9AGAM|nr:hypothetical protein M407DRAFT_26875 [Tulasnella calospora MUT 4182]
MSTSQSCLISGIFCLANGKRIAVPSKKSTFSLFFTFYDSDILGLDEISHPAEIRIYSSSTGPSVLPDDTLIYLVGRLAFSAPPAEINASRPSQNDLPPAHIDVIFHAAFPGDPSDPSYDSRIPLFPPFVFSIGHVRSTAQLLGDGALRAFPMATSEWVRDAAQPFIVSAAFDTSNPRWTNAPTPLPNTAVQVVGPFSHITSDSTFGIRIEHITLNLSRLNAPQGPPSNTPDNQDGDEGGSPRKRSRFRGSRPAIPQSPASNSTSNAGQASSSASSAATARYSNQAAGPSRSSLSATSPVTPTPSRQAAALSFITPAVPRIGSGNLVDTSDVISVESPMSVGSHISPSSHHLASPAATLGSSASTSTAMSVDGPATAAGRTTRRRGARGAAQTDSNLAHPNVENAGLPPLRSFSGVLPRTPVTTGGIVINEPNAGMSARRRGKQPAREENVD